MTENIQLSLDSMISDIKNEMSSDFDFVFELVQMFFMIKEHNISKLTIYESDISKLDDKNVFCP